MFVSFDVPNCKSFYVMSLCLNIYHKREKCLISWPTTGCGSSTSVNTYTDRNQNELRPKNIGLDLVLTIFNQNQSKRSYAHYCAQVIHTVPNLYPVSVKVFVPLKSFVRNCMTKFCGNSPFWRRRREWQDNVRMALRKVSCENVNWTCSGPCPVSNFNGDDDEIPI
jgi:hypothetical protein